MVSDPRVQLAWSGANPGSLHRLILRSGGVSGALEALRRGDSRVGESARIRTRTDVDAIYESLRSVPARFIPAPELPARTRRADPPPLGLFVRGQIPDQVSVAVVGSRRATGYGLRFARRLGSLLAESGVCVISGLARGIDGAAHRGMTERQGVGVAILGCGLDRWYPPEHEELGRSIVDCGGAVVSEYPCGVAPEAWRFPVRNRLIAAMASMVVVVEAAVDGGALITARLALEMGVDVMAVPGDVDRATSIGCNQLIRDGAHPLLDPTDLLEALGFAGHRVRRDDDDRFAALLGTSGASVEEVVTADGRSVSEVLADLDRWEREGVIRIDGGWVEKAR